MTATPFDIAMVPAPGLTVIEASAGTGKTFSLAALTVSAIADGRITARELCTVTFTEAATAELRSRLRRRIARGVDLFDCVLPTRFGRHGTILSSEGRFNIKNRRFATDADPLDPAAPTPALARALPEVPAPKHIGASASQWTNGQRLAAGLPPHAPRKLKRATPTEPNVARRHAPSPSPSRAAFASLPVYV